jgi:hypothetical protein
VKDLELNQETEYVFIYNKNEIEGLVNSINKRASIMVMDGNGNYMDKYKNRYTKYYVPINLLKKI